MKINMKCENVGGDEKWRCLWNIKVVYGVEDGNGNGCRDERWR